MKLERIISIVMLMLARKRVSAQNLAKMFNVSLRTIYRDLETIGYAGIPLFSIPGPHGGYGIVEEYKFEKGLFTTNDIIAILTALGGVQSAFAGKDILNAIAKVKGLVSEDQIHAIETKSGQITIDHTPWFGSKINLDIEEIITAINDKNLLFLNYSDQSGKMSERKVEPYKLFLKSANWYLIGYCLSKQDFRIFKLSRISRLKILDEAFELRSYDFKNKNITENKNIKVVKLLVNNSMIDWLTENFKVLKIEKQEPDKCIVEISFVEDDFGYSLLFRLGDKGLCLEPDNIRVEMQKRLNYLLEKYK
jgi:predicted DNA-binding transcriptional regulator YafY